MRILSLSLGAAALASIAVGCVASPGDDGADENLGVTAQAEIDPLRGFMVSQSGATVASAWAGTTSGGLDVEYWVAKSTYSAGAARTFSGTSETCAVWKRNVCSAGWTGATFYKATAVETPLDCGFPPGPCAPPVGAVSFLGSGSYRTSTANPGTPFVPFAWTYSTGTCEYWANNHAISSGLSGQSPLSPLYTSLSQFESSVCAMSTPPTTFYTSYYEPVANFCSIPTC